jgi:hypothetical protein
MPRGTVGIQRQKKATALNRKSHRHKLPDSMVDRSFFACQKAICGDFVKIHGGMDLDRVLEGMAGI